jgi:signal transduction histidine kinase
MQQLSRVPWLWLGADALIAAIDYFSGPSVSMTLFYLVPTVGAGWFAGRRAAIVVGASAGVMSFVADYTFQSTTPSPAVLWNACTRIVVLVIAAFVVDRLREDRTRLRLLDAERSRSIQMLEKSLLPPARQMLDVLDHWDGTTGGLIAVLRPSADEIAFLASDFATIVRVQEGQLPMRATSVDLTGLMGELLAEPGRPRGVGWIRPARTVWVTADPDRLRQALATLLSLASDSNQFMSVSVNAAEAHARVVISDELGGSDRPIASHDLPHELGLRYELGLLLIAAQGGTIEVSRRPLSKTLRIVVTLAATRDGVAGGGAPGREAATRSVKIT